VVDVIFVWEGQKEKGREGVGVRKECHDEDMCVVIMDVLNKIIIA
jgi:hypothetical protein